VSVAIEQAAFDTYLNDLRADPDMAKFEGMFANSPFFGISIPVGLAKIARTLLARAVVTNEVEGTAQRFVSYVRENTTDAIAVMALSGLEVDQEIKFGPHVSLMPMDQLPRSSQRGEALDQYSSMNPRFGKLCAMATKFKYGPIFYTPKNPQPREEMGAPRSPDAQGMSVPWCHEVNEAMLVLGEASNLLGVAGVYPQYQMSWVQPDDWLMWTGMSPDYKFSTFREEFGREQAVQKSEIEAIAASYFSLDPARRRTVLRIPLDRLSRAGRQPDLADRAIDLGIALEALLLHDLESYRGELSFRLSLRGAWLIGDDANARNEIQKSLKQLYDLRSRVVHSGSIAQTSESENKIRRAVEHCQILIRRMIELKCEIDWQKIVVGG
jgi:hypothetical protein